MLQRRALFAPESASLGQTRVRNGSTLSYVIALHLDWEHLNDRHDSEIIWNEYFNIYGEWKYW